MRRIHAFVTKPGLGRVGFFDDVGDFFTIDAASEFDWDDAVPEVSWNEVYNVTDFDGVNVESLPSSDDYISALDAEDADYGASMSDAVSAAGNVIGEAAGAIGDWLPSGAEILDFTKDIAKVGLQYYMAREQAELAAEKLNAQRGGTVRYVTRIDPATGKAILIDSFTGKPVGTNGAPLAPGGFDAVSNFVRENPLVIIGAGLALMFLLSTGSTNSGAPRRRKAS